MARSRSEASPRGRARPRLGAVLAVAAMTAACAALAQPRSAAGAFAVRAKAGEALVALLPSGAPARAITLEAPRGDEPNYVAKARIAPRKDAPLRIGFVRAPAAADRRIPLASLAWSGLPDGSLAARVSVTSKGAAGVRVFLGFDGAGGIAEARITDAAAGDRVYAAGGDELTRARGYWSPVIEGDTAVVELRLAPGQAPEGALVLRGVGHLVAAGAQFKDLQDIGTAQGCERDVVCTAPSAALSNAARSVVETVAVDGQYLVLCTATLLNSVPQSDIPYVLGADHCYDPDHDRTVQQVQVVADTLSLYWFFDATACGNNTPGSYVQTGGGAAVLYESPAPGLDLILVRLNANPPPGAWYSGWQAKPVLPGTSALVLHHANGDLKKLTLGTTLGYTGFNGQGSYIEIDYAVGATEPGSSGAPLLTCASLAGGVCTGYDVRGTLVGGDSACDFRQGTDAYSRLDLAYEYVAPWLAPQASFPTGDNVAVEYYNVDLDHFFVTATAAEQADVDGGGAGPGWFRTGYSFNTLPPDATDPGAAQVCRFYGSVYPGPNSHFYTLDPGECAFLQMLQAKTSATLPRWNYEGIAFASYPPSGGGCPAGMTPVYRYYNNGFPVKDANHRFVTDSSVGAFLFSQGWSLEGVGMCAPG
jgi:hypothetical protein